MRQDTETSLAMRAKPAIDAAKRTAAMLAGVQDTAVAWSLVAIAGAIWIAIAGPDNRARQVVPVLMMLAYAAYALSRRMRNAARVADAVYFLGFLWTLFALITTLVQHGHMIKAQHVYVVFGYALITTAAGMFLRLGIIQFQRVLPDQMQEARSEIDAGVMTFATELEMAREALQVFSKTSTATIEKWVADVNAAGLKIVEDYAEIHRRSAAESGRRLRDVIDDLSANLTGIKMASHALDNATSDYVKHITEGGKELGTAVTKINSSLSRRAAGLDEHLRRISESVETTSEAWRTLVAVVEGTSSRLEEMARGLKILDDVLTHLPTTAGSLRGEMDQLTKQITESGRTYGEAAVGSVKSMNEAAEKMEHAVSEALDFVGRRLESPGNRDVSS